MILEHYRDPGVIIKHIAKIPDVERYLPYRLKRGKVICEEHKESLDYERLIAGKWILKTEDFSLSTLELIEAYKNLSEVERAFRTIKSFLDLRPIYHRDERRVKGHVFICVRAYYLQKVTEKLLTGAGLELGGLKTIEKLSEIKLIKSKLNGKRILQAIQLKKSIKLS
jgi:transposase